jgi:uncharacterized membrane protein YbhN (UPF0104 family)
MVKSPFRVHSENVHDAGPSRARGRILILAKVAISGGLLWLLFSRVDVARLWSLARTASVPWLGGALALYLAMILASAWRWGLLLQAQRLDVRFRHLTGSFLVATFFNNFLPSNIGGDVVRIADTAPAAGSRTLAATVVLIDRGIGLLGLGLLAAVGATLVPVLVLDGWVGPGVIWGGFAAAMAVAAPVLLLPQALPRLLQPLRLLHPAWIDERLARMGGAISRFREAPSALFGCFAGAVVVQAMLVAFYLAVARSMAIPIGFAELAVIVPVSFLVQMLPVSVNGFGIREATFGFYFSRLGLPLESALVVSFVGAGLVMLFSMSGGVAYLVRKDHSTPANILKSPA